MIDLKPAYYEVKPEMIKVKPAYYEVKPEIIKMKPAYYEVKFEMIKVKPAYYEVKPEIIKVKPTYYEVKPEMIDIKAKSPKTDVIPRRKFEFLHKTGEKKPKTAARISFPHPRCARSKPNPNFPPSEFATKFASPSRN